MTNKRLLVMYAMVGAALSAAMISYLDPSSELSKSAIPTASAAQVDFFLKIDGIDGGVTNPVSGDSGWIHLQDFQLDQKGCQSFGGGGGAGRCSSQFVADDMISTATEKILPAVQSGKLFKTAEFVAVSSGGDKPAALFSINWGDLVMIEWHSMGNSGSPTESFTFDARTMHITVGTPITIVPCGTACTTGQ